MELIRAIIKECQYKSYLELGLSIGSTFNAIAPHVKRAVGVDTKLTSNLLTGKHLEYWEGTTDEFFNQNTETFDVIFIDADHTPVQVLRDINNSLRVLNTGGTILVHDMDPVTVDYERPVHCGRGHVLVIDLYDGDLEVCVLPAGVAGTAIIRRKADRRALEWTSL